MYGFDVCLADVTFSHLNAVFLLANVHILCGLLTSSFVGFLSEQCVVIDVCSRHFSFSFRLTFFFREL